jgi:hypothetical protein
MIETESGDDITFADGDAFVSLPLRKFNFATSKSARLLLPHPIFRASKRAREPPECAQPAAPATGKQGIKKRLRATFFAAKPRPVYWGWQQRHTNLYCWLFTGFLFWWQSFSQVWEICAGIFIIGQFFGANW